jgi:hypothetical protein
MLRRRSAAGMNPRMAAIMGVFQILWVYYGETRSRMECDCDLNQFLERRGVRSLRQ